MPVKAINLLVSLLFSAAALADRGPDLPDYPADEVAPGVFVIHGPVAYPNPENRGFMNNPAFLVTDAGVVVVDPGSSVQTGEMVLRQARKVTDKPLLGVINTHVHGDHWLGNQAMRDAAPDVPIYAHPNMLEAVEEGAGQAWVDLMLRATDGATEGTAAVGPNQALVDGAEVELGGLTFRVHFYGQVHTHTDLMIEVPEKELLFLGDNANNHRIVRMDDGSFAGSVAALDKVKQDVSAEVLVPGHGPTGGWEIVDAYRDYMANLYGAVEFLYEEGLSDFEMKPKVAERLTAFKDWPGFEDELGKHVSLAYLQVEEAAF
ncbi:MAG: MBL fold metallo-hydrolase [Pseudomonadota bacterium]|nr:MBL fold metallo-hydrolase [Pseudomonadota bacterium]